MARTNQVTRMTPEQSRAFELANAGGEEFKELGLGPAAAAKQRSICRTMRGVSAAFLAAHNAPRPQDLSEELYEEWCDAVEAAVSDPAFAEFGAYFRALANLE